MVGRYILQLVGVINEFFTQYFFTEIVVNTDNTSVYATFADLFFYFALISAFIGFCFNIAVNKQWFKRK